MDEEENASMGIHGFLAKFPFMHGEHYMKMKEVSQNLEHGLLGFMSIS